MLYEFLVILFVIVCLFMILLVLVQKGKGGMGIGTMGGSSQMLFGSSGGQDLFQKITWGLGAIFMFGSLGLSLMKTSTSYNIRYTPKTQVVPQKFAEVAPNVSQESTQEAPVKP